MSSFDLSLGSLLLLFGELLLLLEQSGCAFLARHSILVSVGWFNTSCLSSFVGNCASLSSLFQKFSKLGLLRLFLSNLFKFLELFLLLSDYLCLNLSHGFLDFECSLLYDSILPGFLGTGLLLSNCKNLLGFDDGNCRCGRFPEFLEGFLCFLFNQLLFGCLNKFSFFRSLHELSLDFFLHFFKFFG